ncbi:sulfite exporter tauE/SafE domain-containing protein [Ditylenchus destructor]|nr:sulfite exporter tauE/SafE domain-containing protein [Ditylenchus destructor]
MTKVHCSDVGTGPHTNGFQTPGAEAYISEPETSSVVSLPEDNGGRFKRFFRKYFLEGQKLDREQELRLQECRRADLPFHEKYRKYIGFAIPFVFMHTVWWTLAIRYDIFRLYPTRYEMALTMILGATVAGATSEGGGAVAFPVMTLLLHIDSTVARDFSLMIQSCGMTSATFTILWMKVQLEWHSIVFCTLGSTFGIVFGLQFVDDIFDGPTKKMLFVSVFFSFAISLYILNRQKKRTTYAEIPDFNWWKGAILLLVGFTGGLCSAVAGSGADICSFSILTLLFRVSEKVATPTSVVLMAANTVVGFFWRQLIMTDISTLAWEYFEVAVPVVVICAPFGALLSSHLHRQVLASFVYILEALALIGFLITFPPIHLVFIGAGIIFVSFFFFLGLCKLGRKLEESSNGGKLLTDSNMIPSLSYATDTQIPQESMYQAA